MKYIIEDNIPITKSKKGPGAKTEERITVESLQVGQSVLFPSRAVANNAYKAVKGKKFTSRLVDGKVRVWRIE